ncbi:MAG: glycoside hydrolase family 15 protein [SAR324 cluster bacterium]|nr:glycoside hydrolase family 15 protein [SAR324 cluster bacterium]
MNYQPIENYGIIGDLHSVALVGMDGSIDFLSFPHFDSPTIFAALLDHKKGGRFRIAPTLENVRHKQMYLPDTNVLITRFLSLDGLAEVSDFMPVEMVMPSHELVRRAKCVRGEVKFEMVFQPRFDYGRADHTVEEVDGAYVFASQGEDKTTIRLRCSVPVRIVDGVGHSEFVLRAGETATFVMEEVIPGKASDFRNLSHTVTAFKETVNYWRGWVGRSNYKGRWLEMVNRSALVLKLLTSQTHGSMVAAPTFGLPEHVGGERNWDYRYSWIRDSAFSLYALIRLGYTDEAGAYMHWIEDRCNDLNPDGSLQIMYAIDGSKRLEETVLTHFEGYMGSSPVRIGNAAYDQLQLDIYGELMDSVYLFDRYGAPIAHDLWANLKRLIDWVCDNWQLPDEGIWEVRGGRKEFLYSRLMCWVAIDRGIRLAQSRSFPAPLSRWFEVRNTIYNEIFEHFWDDEKKAFIQYKNGNTLDASCLIMPLVKFISPTDPRWLSTLDAVRRELVDDSLVFRYKDDAASDGLTGEEGTFCMCSFWYVECLARAGRLDESRLYFEKMLSYANHLGLYAEELGPCGEHLGNFPQAFTHLALISAAYDLDRRLNLKGGSPDPMGGPWTRK